MPTPTNAPLFETPLSELAQRLPYSIRYLDDLANGYQPIRPRFRRIASQILGRSEVDLFGEERGNVTDVTNPRTEGGVCRTAM